MRKIIFLLIVVLPFAAFAQKELFMKEFNEVNNWFFVQQNSMVVQKYTYYKDSAMSNADDSSFCTIVKNKNAIHYKVAGMESFSDSGYMVKISHADKYLYVSKTGKTDTAQVRALFNAGFAGYNTYSKKGSSDNTSSWELTGGINGVNSARFVMDLHNHKIKYLEIVLAGNHPLISPFRKPGQESDQAVIIKVEYQYPTDIKKKNIETLSDFITIRENNISPSPKYKEYQIKLLTENK
ncbi:MAG: hypothetical protein JWQ30_1048 [Sediminibacterium sp.]|nr:hypothetical protein [Sediminibacterium sp.]